MDKLPAFGTAVNAVVYPTLQAYQSLLEANADAIKSTRRETFSYGPHERQELDVYYPSRSPSSDDRRAPIFVFTYGGGLVRGDKQMAGYADGLVHCNVGHFFAEHYGFTTVITDYRLLSHGAQFPSGGEDLALVVDWLKSNLAAPDGSTRDLFMMGNSAGGIHLSTYLLAPPFESSRSSISGGNNISLKGAILLSVPFHFRQADPSRSDILKTYFGEQIEDDSPLGLLKSALTRTNGADPFSGASVFVLNGELDPDDELLIPMKDFIETFNAHATEDTKSSFEVAMMKGQNHISPALSLGTGKDNEEAWGRQVGDFCNAHRTAQ